MNPPVVAYMNVHGLTVKCGQKSTPATQLPKDSDVKVGKEIQRRVIVTNSIQTNASANTWVNKRPTVDQLSANASGESVACL